MKTKVSRILTLVPAIIIVLLGAILLCNPMDSYSVIYDLRYMIGDRLSSYYLLLGFVFVAIILAISFSKYGDVKLGEGDPEHSLFQWGSMIFTSTMAADILFFSLHEWAYYYKSGPAGMDNFSAYDNQLRSSVYPLFHWGPIPWAFYILPALAYAYIMYAKKDNIYRMSHACRLKSKFLGNTIDIFAIVALLVATSTTFSLTTPLMTEALCSILGIGHATAIFTIIILCCIAIVYTIAVLFDLKGISKVASSCVFIFLGLIALIAMNSNLQYTVETGLSSVGYLLQNFVSMSLDTGSLRLVSPEGNTFTQAWTVFYWAYWISWGIATPFFIARISKGRTIRQTAIGAMCCGLLGTFTSFIFLGNFGLQNQIKGTYDMAFHIDTKPVQENIVNMILETTNTPMLILCVLLLSMVAFYASTFDSITLVVSQYVCENYTDHPPKMLKLVWSIIFIVFPIALIFTESTLYSLQALNIIFAFPVSLILIRVVYVFLKSLKESK